MGKNNKNILKLEDVSVNYGMISAVRNLSLEVNEGEIVALLGANGAGKSSLIASILGVNRAKKGTISFLDRDITRESTDKIVSSGIAVVPEGWAILPLMTVKENLQLGAYHFKGNVNERLDKMFQRFPILYDRRNLPGGSLSGGQQQMLATARGLMSDPKLLILDEPSLGLAPIIVSELFDILKELRKEGQTILLAEQNAHKAMQCADRVYVLEVGNVVFAGTPQDLANNPVLQKAYVGKT
ncbi:MAG: ABC transporter ATP-binding protein [Dehalococcoidales bacterium]|nr:ABC transporter ATP-binding protein [Dehalococcoidales bacterium]